MEGISPSRPSAGRGRRSDWARLTGHTVEAWPSGEHIMTDRQVERVISPRPAVVPRRSSSPSIVSPPLERLVVVETRPALSGRPRRAASDRLIEEGARVRLDRLQDVRGEALVIPEPSCPGRQPIIWTVFARDSRGRSPGRGGGDSRPGARPWIIFQRALWVGHEPPDPLTPADSAGSFWAATSARASAMVSTLGIEPGSARRADSGRK
jgi:hypothetical protein